MRERNFAYCPMLHAVMFAPAWAEGPTSERCQCQSRASGVACMERFGWYRYNAGESLKSTGQLEQS